MITMTRYGKSAKFTNKEWESLRKRYDYGRAKETSGDRKEIVIDCLICMTHSCYVCESKVICPFRVWSYLSLAPACLAFLNRVVGGTQDFCSGDVDRISWSLEDDEKVKKQLARIQRFMDRVEEKQK